MGLASQMGPCRWGVEASRSGAAPSPALPGDGECGALPGEWVPVPVVAGQNPALGRGQKRPW